MEAAYLDSIAVEESTPSVVIVSWPGGIRNSSEENGRMTIRWARTSLEGLQVQVIGGLLLPQWAASPLAAEGSRAFRGPCQLAFGGWAALTLCPPHQTAASGRNLAISWAPTSLSEIAASLAERPESACQCRRETEPGVAVGVWSAGVEVTDNLLVLQAGKCIA